MVERNSKFEHVKGGRIEIWERDDGLFGVTLAPDIGVTGFPGHTYASSERITGFPETYDEDALMAWGRARWAERSPH
jgi:hypothetical protein